MFVFMDVFIQDTIIGIVAGILVIFSILGCFGIVGYIIDFYYFVRDWFYRFIFYRFNK
jgi:hypothetical protein